MRSHVWMGVGLLGLGASMGAPAWGADKDPFEKPATTVNSAATTSAGSQKVAEKIASELNATCACSTFSASSVTDQRAKTGWGWGEILIADRLALAISQQSQGQVSFATALSQVTTARQQSGWGAIANANGLNVGKLVSDAEKSANAVANAANGAAKGQSQGNVSGAGQQNSGQGVGAGAGHGGGGGGGQGGGGGRGGQGGGGGGGGAGGGGKK